MVAHRYEEAEALVRELKQQFGDGAAGIPGAGFQLISSGMIALVRGDFPRLAGS